MIVWLNKVLGKRFRYRVCFKYRVNGDVIYTITMSIKMLHQKGIDNHRDIKRFGLGPIHKLSGINKAKLENGTIEVEPVCYLGWW